MAVVRITNIDPRCGREIDDHKSFEEVFAGPADYVQGGFKVTMSDARFIEKAWVNCRGSLRGPGSPAYEFSAHVESEENPPTGNQVLIKVYYAGVGLTFAEVPAHTDLREGLFDVFGKGY